MLLSRLKKPRRGLPGRETGVGVRTHAVDAVCANQNVALGIAAVLKVHRNAVVIVLDTLHTLAPPHGDVGQQPVAKTAPFGTDEGELGRVLSSETNAT